MKKYLLISFLLISLFLPSKNIFAQFASENVEKIIFSEEDIVKVTPESIKEEFDKIIIPQDNLLEQPDESNRININSNQNASAVIVKNLKLDKKVYNTGDTINGSITFENPTNTDQSGVYYTLILSGEYSTEPGRYNLPDKSYDGKTLGPVFVPAGKEVEVNFSYEIPKGISGKKLGIFASGHLLSGLPLGFDNAFIDEITGDLPILNIERAYLEVDGNKYGNQVGPTLYATSTGSMKFEIKNDIKESITITPLVEIFDRNTYGELLKSYKEQPVTIEANSKKEISIKLDKTLDPKVYENKVSFLDSDGFLRAEKVTFRYIVGGLIATVQNVVVAKNFEKGKPLDVIVFFSGNPTDINTGTAPLIGEALLSVKFFDNDSNALIGENSVKDLNFDVDLGSTTVGVVPDENVKNLRIETEIIKDEKVLGKYVTVINVENEQSSSGLKNTILIILGILTLILIVTSFIFRRNKKIISISVLLIILIVTSAILFLKDDMLKKASAWTQIVTPYGTVLQPTSWIYVSGNVWESKCQNAKFGVTIYSSIGGYPQVQSGGPYRYGIEEAGQHGWSVVQAAYGFWFPPRYTWGNFVAYVWYTFNVAGQDYAAANGAPLWKHVCDSVNCHRYDRVGTTRNAYLRYSYSWYYPTAAGMPFYTRCLAGNVWNGSACVDATPPINALCSGVLYQCSAGVVQSGSGFVTTINGQQYDNWTCLGLNEGANRACQKIKPLAGQCNYGGSSVSGTTLTNGCSVGTQNSFGIGSTNYTWNCSGVNGGVSTFCTKSKDATQPTISISVKVNSEPYKMNSVSFYRGDWIGYLIDMTGVTNYSTTLTSNDPLKCGGVGGIDVNGVGVGVWAAPRTYATVTNTSFTDGEGIKDNPSRDGCIWNINVKAQNTISGKEANSTIRVSQLARDTTQPTVSFDARINDGAWKTGYLDFYMGDKIEYRWSSTGANSLSSSAVKTTCEDPSRNGTESWHAQTLQGSITSPNTNSVSKGCDWQITLTAKNSSSGKEAKAAMILSQKEIGCGTGYIDCNGVCVSDNMSCNNVEVDTSTNINSASITLSPPIVNPGGFCKVIYDISASQTGDNEIDCNVYNALGNVVTDAQPASDTFEVAPGGEYKLKCSKDDGTTFQSSSKKCVLNPTVIEI
jgi:hypothetical protein